ncbi:adhesion G protein-coupled receptor E5-like [Ruditapes philippinarum]|uniref:adhesion G protein-coupled receptor E5-like n=1 Tax=Ruditapes philippinarum TaxID=129788 RepID=UPI00295BA3BE|nr:adhesion G protein-coupled receptor E5-like [Ruditapes philippinarum]
MHLCVAMVTSYIIFLGGVDRTDNMGFCTAVAVLLQYIYLVVFFLMFAEGIEISFAVLYVFSTKPSIKWILSAAWVIPAFIVGITLAITRMKGYGTQHFCWLSVDNGLIWAFVGPAFIIILINAVLLGFVMRAVFNVKKMRQKQTHAKIVVGIRCLCILLPLLGCTWVIGIFYVNKSTSWIQYLFSFCNGCQITNAYEKKRRKSTTSLILNQSSKSHRFKRFGPVKSIAEEKRSSL